MKNYIVLLALLFGVSACEESDSGLYTGKSYIYFYQKEDIVRIAAPVNGTSFTMNSTVPTDTAYFRVQIVGERSPLPRKILFQQCEENEAVEQAVAGVDYVPFSDPEYQKLLYVPGDSICCNIPVVLKHNPSAGGKTRRLWLRLVPTEDFDVIGPEDAGRGRVDIRQNASARPM